MGCSHSSSQKPKSSIDEFVVQDPLSVAQSVKLNQPQPAQQLVQPQPQPHIEQQTFPPLGLSLSRSLRVNQISSTGHIAKQKYDIRVGDIIKVCFFFKRMLQGINGAPVNMPSEYIRQVNQVYKVFFFDLICENKKRMDKLQ